MSVLNDNLEQILQEKQNKIIPENIVYGKQIFDITGDADITSILYQRVQNISPDTTLKSGDTSTNSVECEIGSYIYGVIVYRYPSDTIPDINIDGWTVLINQQTSGLTDLGHRQNVCIIYKIATSTTEELTVTIPTSYSLSLFMISIKDGHNSSSVIKVLKDSDTNAGFIQKGDIIVCSSPYGFSSEDNANKHVFEFNFKCNETIGIVGTGNISFASRIDIAVAKETTNSGIITNWVNPAETIVIILRNNQMDGTNLLSENIKSGVTIFGVAGTYTGETSEVVEEG